MPTFYIKHITEYNYSDSVYDAASQMMLHPIQDAYQNIPSHTLSITNNPTIETRKDFYGNTVGTFMIIEPHTQLSIISEVEAVTFEKSLPEDQAPLEQQWDTYKQLKNNPLFMDFLDYKPFDGSHEITNLIESKGLRRTTPFKASMALCDYVFNNFKYIQGITNVDSNLNDIWTLKAGVCQDFSILLIQLVRMLDIPARYVSGYICPNDDNSRGEGATHAWVEVYMPFYGWLGLDPTNNVIANQFHVRLAAGRNFKDCTPVKGVYSGQAEEDLFVKVEINTTKSIINDTAFSQNEGEHVKHRNSYRQSLKNMPNQQQ
ncbi:transglutaminase family protein [Tamlana agarivorans]|uniref:Transglutaminase family protein n=1 Tax=Pseudotamlana agarivorans TaxID=481183 RepID=A0ACC5U497_9FLAO|nr:transglutaminase family protein [Tamlana agarivorans]MBU2949125.1 transglutaminase family protein [Tamlana agarivorans]